MGSDMLPKPTEHQPSNPGTPASRGSLDQPDLSAEELEREVGDSEEWDEASHGLADSTGVGPPIRWVESILGTW
jgi:hypothetical protein